MTRDEHLMVIAMEECHEVAQRLSKALRFGMEEVQPGQHMTNRERVTVEVADLRAMFDMLGIDDDSPFVHRLALEKRAKVEHFLNYSAECGTLAGDPAPTGKE